MLIENFVKEIPYKDKLKIINDHAAMEAAGGKTGDTTLRRYTEQYMKEQDIGMWNFVVVSELLTARVWKFFAMILVDNELNEV